MQDLKNRTAIFTGTASGSGLALARRVAREGPNQFAAAGRNPALLPWHRR